MDLFNGYRFNGLQNELIQNNYFALLNMAPSISISVNKVLNDLMGILTAHSRWCRCL